MHLPQSLSRMPESFPGGSLKVCSLFLGRVPHMGFPCLSRCRVVFRRRRSAQGHFAFPSASFRELDDVRNCRYSGSTLI